MQDVDHAAIAANYMGAVAHILTGRAGTHSEFIAKVELILSSAEPHALQLMQFSETVRRTGRPVIWIHHTADAPGVPQIGLVARAVGKVHIIENCMLWMPQGGRQARLVPDSFGMGAFRFDEDLRLRRLDRAPARDFEAATTGMERAYRRLLDIEAAQRRRGDTFALPSHEPLARAA